MLFQKFCCLAGSIAYLLPTCFTGGDRGLDIIYSIVEGFDVLIGVQASRVIVLVGDHPWTASVEWQGTPVMSRAYMLHLLQIRRKVRKL